jgi:hypothetical protein
MRQLQRKTSKHFAFLWAKISEKICQEMTSDVYSVYECIGTVYTCMKGSSWQWSYGSWFYNYLCNQYLSPHRCRDWYWSHGLTPVPIWKMPCMIRKISCHNIFITYFSLTFFQALSFILQKRSLNWQIAKTKSLRELPLFEYGFRKISNNVDLYNDVRKCL